MEGVWGALALDCLVVDIWRENRHNLDLGLSSDATFHISIDATSSTRSGASLRNADRTVSTVMP